MKPLDGLTVVVTRAKTQASVLTDKLVALGAHTVGVATIEIVAPADGGASLNAALVSCSYDQLVVGSPNGAKALAAAVAGLIDTGELDATALPPVACVGPSTAAKLADSPLIVNVVPGRAVAEGLLDAMSTPQPGSDRLLLVQAEVARDALEVGLAGNGWRVDRVVAYRTIDAQVITFTSSSTVERFVRLIGIEALPPTVASIGPITSDTARGLDVTVDIEADLHTIDGLIEAIVAWATAQRERIDSGRV